MARLSFSRWPSLFFLISKPHQSAAHTCFTVLAAKNIRGIDVKSDLWIKKIPTPPRRTRQKPQSAAGVLCLYVSLSKKQLINTLRVCSSHLCCKKLTTPGAVYSYFSNCDLSGKSLARKSIAHFRSSSLANCESFIQNNMGLYFSNFL